MELTDSEQEEIARQIVEGNTSGRIDNTGEDGETVFVSWNLCYEKWS